MKRIFGKNILYLTLLMTFSLVSCYSELEDVNFGKVQWSPELGLPLVDSKFTIIEVLEANANSLDYSADDNNTVVITIKDDSLFSQSASQYFALSNQSLNVPPIILTQDEVNTFNSYGSVKVDREFLVDYPNQGDLDEILIDQGEVATQVTQDFPADVDLSYFMTDPNDVSIVSYNNFFNYTIGQNPISTDESTDRFKNVEFKFDGDPNQRKIRFSFEIELQQKDNQPLVFGANSIDMTVDMQELEFGELRGDLSSQNISTEQNTIKTDFLADNEFLKDVEYYFENPQFKMNFTNSMGLPVLFDINNFLIHKDGQTTVEPINNSIELEKPIEGAATTSETKFDNIFKRIINDVPDSVSLQIDGFLDPNDTPDNYVTRDSYIQGGYEINLPLELSLSGLEINQTVSLDDLDPKQLQYALFKFTSENSLPIDLNFKADLLDQDGVVVMNLFDGKFLAGGTESQPTTISDIIRLEDERDIAGLKNVAKVGIKATVATTNNGNDVVRITADAMVQFNLAIQAKYNVNL